MAKEALEHVLGSATAGGAREYALVTLGGSCTVSVPVPFSTDPQAVVTQALALDQGASNDVQLVLLSDGEETCGSDPLAVAQAVGNGVRAKPLARVVRLNAIGLGLEAGGSDEQQIQAIARAAGGNYFRASATTDLAAVLGQASGLASTGASRCRGCWWRCARCGSRPTPTAGTCSPTRRVCRAWTAWL